MDRNQYNTVVAACMEMMNSLDRFKMDESPERSAAMREALGILVRVLSPITPHICHQLWQVLEMEEELLNTDWPTVDSSALISEKVMLIIQINGKLRAKIEIEADADDKKIQEAVLSEPQISRRIENAPIKKFVIVPGRLVNIVV